MWAWASKPSAGMQDLIYLSEFGRIALLLWVRLHAKVLEKYAIWTQGRFGYSKEFAQAVWTSLCSQRYDAYFFIAFSTTRVNVDL